MTNEEEGIDIMTSQHLLNLPDNSMIKMKYGWVYRKIRNRPIFSSECLLTNREEKEELFSSSIISD